MNTYIASVIDEPYLRESENGKFIEATRTTEAFFMYESGDSSVNVFRIAVFPSTAILNRDKVGRNLIGAIDNTIIMPNMSETELYVALSEALRELEIKGIFKLERISLDAENSMHYVVGNEPIRSSFMESDNSDPGYKIM